MDLRRIGVVSSVLVGTALFVGSLYLIWRPTADTPNYWVGHTSSLFLLVPVATFGGTLVVVGFVTGMAPFPEYLRAGGIRLTGGVAVVGGVLGLGRITHSLAVAVQIDPADFTIPLAAGYLLLAAGVAGLVARYPSLGRHGMYGAGVVASGFSLLAWAKFLDWGVTFVQPRTGALTYLPLGTRLFGTVVAASGAIILGLALRNAEETPRWLGPLLVAAGLLSIPLDTSTTYGLAWVVMGGFLFVDPEPVG